MAERVGDDGADHQARLVTRPRELLERADRRGTLTLLAERREVVLADEEAEASFMASRSSRRGHASTWARASGSIAAAVSAIR